jgi:hypothetical protein
MSRMARLLLVSLSSALSYAGIVSFSTSGTWATSLGLIQAGDAYSFTAAWDTAAITNVCFFVANCLGGGLISFNLTMPQATGLSSSLPATPGGPLVIFESVFLSAGSLGFVEVQPRSPIDGNIYEFVFDSTCSETSVTLQVGPPFPTTMPSACDASGRPSSAPESGTATYLLIGIGLAAAISRRDP